MELLSKAFGDYQTNCYILKTKIGDFIIDPGVESTTWINENTNKAICILNTHGHYDHIWCNKELKDIFNIPIFCPKEDAFMLESDCFNLGLTTCKPDFYVENDEIFYFSKSDNGKINIESNKDIKKNKDKIKVEYMFFPGHTPGCSMIKIGEYIFSGDFIFYRSIGRSDFPYSNTKDMQKSLEKFAQIQYDMMLYPGHGKSTTIKNEQKNLHLYMR
ncbi:MBL fold metallo-hydrolase [Helicobacter sp. MIT 14-3879]|uniref:MBL fold metallo-hydrolase n=1 Tax=Helicobacter sp. MIT 14-3879 TaxID=2040649 RepID=UPI000E1EFA7E|nr:MBL fold metallo-hydrolase [Helicobacter sp. MIT 14-3879]RDU61633.1 MBL fold metallo-hydrolase [Helicobacter sp. MIT 14-3879]